MSEMAEVLAAHAVFTFDDESRLLRCECGLWMTDEDQAEHVAEVLTAAGFGPVKEAAAKSLEAAADEREVRSEMFLTTMQNMVGQPGYTNTDIIRYGAYSAEAQTTSTWLRARAAAVRGEG